MRTTKDVPLHLSGWQVKVCKYQFMLKTWISGSLKIGPASLRNNLALSHKDEDESILQTSIHLLT